MRTIFKYTVGWSGTWQIVDLPRAADIIHVAIQNDLVTFWAEVDTEQPLEAREFAVFETGANLDHERGVTHRGTILEGSFVWHLYEAWPDPEKFWATLTEGEKLARLRRDGP